ncbi:hypothetical protein JF50_21060 [Pseudoalteromonas luteoviolacea]|uniref:Oxidoreductase FAD/NAD(P)-binding domain-containing protein n=1 Tax=Pseudoalteromonas luteoviolacea TaxID=43657 RepID=A0A0C1MEY5_9GAMM|nr:hypothetical protein [Pseudoalteromonas luteoviolacea]KID55349.1 hypothetical protein JF50_21060 [Pseudoalteromonas luteoviolacea]
MSYVNCQLDTVTKLNDSVYRIVMTPQENVEYKPGQYLKLGVKDKEIPFSITSSPNVKNIEIHVGGCKVTKAIPDAVAHLMKHKDVKAKIGLGNAYFKQSGRPVILFAAGTGFGYIKSIITHLQELDYQKDVYLYWGVRSAEDFYEYDQLCAWAQENTQVNFIPVVKEDHESWEGRTGSLVDNILCDFDDFSEFDIYLAGRFDLMPSTRAAFIDKGACLEHMYSDAFDYI